MTTPVPDELAAYDPDALLDHALIAVTLFGYTPSLDKPGLVHHADMDHASPVTPPDYTSDTNAFSLVVVALEREGAIIYPDGRPVLIWGKTYPLRHYHATLESRQAFMRDIANIIRQRAKKSRANG